METNLRVVRAHLTPKRYIPYQGQITVLNHFFECNPKIYLWGQKLLRFLQSTPVETEIRDLPL